MTDPPFGIGIEYSAFIDTEENVKKLIEETLPLMLKAAPIVAIATGIRQLWWYPQPTWILGHFNPAGERCSSWGFTNWMPVLVYGKCPYLAKGLGSRPDSFSTRPKTYKPNGHPCPKHPSVWRWFVNRIIADDSGTVIDPFMGSGTTLEAAKMCGLKAIGIEIEERYCEIAANRLRQGVLPFAG